MPKRLVKKEMIDGRNIDGAGGMWGEALGSLFTRHSERIKVAEEAGSIES
jgi:hypothetical protein